MRRRADQRHPRRRMAQARDQLGHLHPRQLPAFAGLGALRDLDLQLLAPAQILGRHPEAARRHLLDLGAGVVAVGLRREMRRILAALAAVAARADPVHRHVQRLVRLRRQRAERHARRHEAFADRGHALDLLHRDRRAQRLDVEQVAQVNGRVRAHLRRVPLPEIERRPVARALQQVHRGRLPGVGLAGAARLVEAADRQDVGRAAPGQRVHALDLALDAVHADPADPAGHAGEELGAHRA